jgi:hypothetical protein
MMHPQGCFEQLSVELFEICILNFFSIDVMTERKYALL